MPGCGRKIHISLAHHFFVILDNSSTAFCEPKGGKGQHLGCDVLPSTVKEKFGTLVTVLREQYHEKKTREPAQM